MSSINADAVPVFAASVVRCQVIPPSKLFLVKPVGGKVVLSNPSLNGSGKPVT